MGANLFGFFRSRSDSPPIEEKAFTLNSAALAEFFAAPSSLAFGGTAEGAMRCAPVACGVRLIAESISILCPKLYREGPDGREAVVALDHPLAKLLRRPNPWHAPGDLLRQLTVDLLLHGDAFAAVTRVRNRPRELHRIDPRAVAVETDAATGEPTYRVTLADGSTKEFSFSQVAHFRGVSTDGIRGVGLLLAGREAIGLALALEAHGVGLFNRGARPGGVLEVSGRLTSEMLERLRASFSSIYGGTGNAGRTAILESGVKFTPATMASTDAQYLENRRFQILEIARLLNLPPTLLADESHATFSNVESLAQQFLDRTLVPIIEAFEDALDRVLLTEAERDAGFEIEFDVSGFTRADIAARFAAYKSGIESGVLTLNEARNREGLPPVQGGDTPMRSVQTLPLNQTAQAQ